MATVVASSAGDETCQEAERCKASYRIRSKWFQSGGSLMRFRILALGHFSQISAAIELNCQTPADAIPQSLTQLSVLP